MEALGLDDQLYHLNHSRPMKVVKTKVWDFGLSAVSNIRLGGHNWIGKASDLTRWANVKEGRNFGL